MKENQTGGGKTHAPRRVGRGEVLFDAGVSIAGMEYAIMTQEQYDAMMSNTAVSNTTGIHGLHGLLNALENGKGHKYGIYKRLGIVNAPDGGNGGHPGNAQGRIPHEHPTYYYHGDHLGSSNVITDNRGELYQHLEYFAYGEGWVDEHRNRTNLPFKFTGKELDPETGLYYYGARYYDPRVSLFISTDPIDRFTPDMPPGGLNLYQYALWNPIRMVDPTGMVSGEAKK